MRETNREPNYLVAGPSFMREYERALAATRPRWLNEYLEMVERLNGTPAQPKA